MTKVFFILGITTFFLFLVQATALFGASSLINANIEGFVPPIAPTTIDFFGTLTFVVANFGVFFTLMTISSTFLIVGSVIFVAYGFAMLWAILELIRGI